MAAGGGGAGSRSMERTPTWAVAVVCLVIVVISILMEHAIHLLGKWLKKNHKRALYEALEKIKSELMLMGFISFLLTVSQSSISKICVPMSVGNSWHPCNPTEEDDIAENLEEPDENTGGRRRLLQTAGSVRAFRRILAAGGSSDSCPEGKVALISGEAINQLHIFIFVLAVSHVLYCICTLAFGRLKMRKWKSWEMETRTAEYQFTHDPARFRFARDTSFGRRHLNFWSESPLLICKSRRLKGNQIQYGLQWPPLPEHRQRLRHLPPRAPPRAPRRLLIGSPSLPLFHFSLLLLLLPTVIPSLEPARKIWPPKRARAPEVHLLGFLHPPQPPDEEDLSPFLFGFRCRGNRAGSFDEGRVASARKAVSTRTYPGRASCAELPWHPSPLGRTTSHERKKLKPGNRGWATAQYSPCEDPSLLIWIVCFFRQFVSSVSKVDYLTLRHGFIMAHLAPQSSSKFNFQKYIKRSLEEDFTVVVGISPAIWFMAVVFLLFNTHGWHSYLWQPFIPLIIILLVGTKLQVIITKMAIQIMERGDVVKGVPVVQPRDNLFWFNRPGLLLFLIHFVLFQNAFQLAFFAWSWYEFGYPSCFHKRIEDIIIRISMGILIQVLCSYVTLPLYALVTQMGTNLKPTIFSERVAAALRKWHHTARKNVKESRKSGSVTPYTSRPPTPTHGLSPVHLLQYYNNEVDYSVQNSPQKYFVDDDQFDPEGLPSPSGHSNDESFTRYRNATLKRFVEGDIEMREVDVDDGRLQLPIRHDGDGRVNSVVSIDFSFDKMEKGKTRV